MTRLQTFLQSQRALYVLVALFIALGTLYSVVNPIFEAGDELWHFPHVQYIATGHGLPVQDPTQDQLWEQEGGQPPLYYVTSALLTFWIDTSDMPARLWRNPYAQIGVPLAFGNKNMVVHTPAENFPWQGATLAVHLIRLLSILFSAGTVYLTYKITLEILTPLSRPPSLYPSISLSSSVTSRSLANRPSSPPLLALVSASFVAFNPMFLFISASVNNDSLAALLATASILLSIQLVTRGITTRRTLILGILVGLAILTKVSNLALGVVAAAVILYASWKHIQSNFPHFQNFLRAPLPPFVRQIILSYLVFGIPILLLCGWWFFRNYQLYGDPTAFNVWLQIAGGRPPQTLIGLLGEFQGFRISYWGNFGGVNVIAPEWVYTILDTITLIAVLGLALGALRRALPTLLWIPTLHLIVVFIALIRWTLMTYASQGRLIFPAIAAVSILLTCGLYSFAQFLFKVFQKIIQQSSLRGASSAMRCMPSPQSQRDPVSESSISSSVFRLSSFILHPSSFVALPSLFLFLFALAAPFTLIAPAYAPPPLITDASTVPNPVHITYDAGPDQPELVGFDAPRVIQNNQLPLTLYWRTASPITADLALYIHVYDVNGNSLGQWDAYPGNGILPPRLWTPNQIIKDEYRVPLKSPEPVPSAVEGTYPPIGRVEVGMTRVGSSTVLPAHNPQGETITPSLATFKFAQPLNTPAAPRVTFADQFNLLQLSPAAPPITLHPGDTFNLGVTLQARQTPDAAYTLFAHIVDANGIIIAQRDAQPLNNTYPTTFWDPNEQVTDTLTLPIPATTPPGTYTLEFGIYRASDLQRLPTNGNPWGAWQVENDHLTAPIEIIP